MSNPTIPKPIKIVVSNGTKGQPVIVRNMATGEILTTVIGENSGTDGHAVVDLQNFASGYTTDSDRIEVIVAGERLGSSNFVPSGDVPETVTITASAITSGLARGI